MTAKIIGFIDRCGTAWITEYYPTVSGNFAEALTKLLAACWGLTGAIERGEENYDSAWRAGDNVKRTIRHHPRHCHYLFCSFADEATRLVAVANDRVSPSGSGGSKPNGIADNRSKFKSIETKGNESLTRASRKSEARTYCTLGGRKIETSPFLGFRNAAAWEPRSA